MYGERTVPKLALTFRLFRSEPDRNRVSDRVRVRGGEGREGKGGLLSGCLKCTVSGPIPVL